MSKPAAPAPLDRARQRYRRILSHLELASRAAEAPLNEQQLWHLMARTVSPRWARAYTDLQTAEQCLSRLNNTENKPLGAIGAALDSEHTIAAEAACLAAQSHFTLVDERLRSKKFLGLLLDDLAARQKSLEVSMGISQGVLKLTIDAPQTGAELPADSLRLRFGVLARKLFTPDIKHVPVAGTVALHR